MQTQAKLAGEGYSRTAAIEAVPHGVRITARDNAGNKLTSVAHVERGLLTPWRTPAAETEHGVGLLGLPVFDSAHRS